MADVYRNAQFTLIMLCPRPCVTEEEAWKGYGERLWTLPEALLSRELRFKFRDDNVTPITSISSHNVLMPTSRKNLPSSIHMG